MSFNSSAALACSSLSELSAFGVEILSFQANQVANYTGAIGMVNIQVYLPFTEWNGRMQAIGGDGWQAGLNYVSLAGMAAAMSEGYVSFTTDDAFWSLSSPENPNRYLMGNLASTSLNNPSIIGKNLANSYDGTQLIYSY